MGQGTRGEGVWLAMANCHLSGINFHDIRCLWKVVTIPVTFPTNYLRHFLFLDEADGETRTPPSESRRPGTWPCRKPREN